MFAMRGWRWVCAMGMGAAIVGACTPQKKGEMPENVRPAGEKREILAEYSFGQLSATLPAEVGVATLRAAAESTLRSRGYVIIESASTDDRMRVVGTSRVDGRSEPTTISAKVTYSGVRVMIESGAFGDEGVSRVILDDVLRRLSK